MRRVLWIAALAVAVMAGAAVAQGQKGSAKAPAEPQKQQSMQKMQTHDQAMRMEHMQATMKDCDQLMERVRETNRWMEKQNADAGYREMGRYMEEAGKQLHLMLVKMDQMSKDKVMQKDQDRLRDMDRLNDRLHTMVKEMDQAHKMLRQMAGGPA